MARLIRKMEGKFCFMFSVVPNSITSSFCKRALGDYARRTAQSCRLELLRTQITKGQDSRAGEPASMAEASRGSKKKKAYLSGSGIRLRQNHSR